MEICMYGQQVADEIRSASAYPPAIPDHASLRDAISMAAEASSGPAADRRREESRLAEMSDKLRLANAYLRSLRAEPADAGALAARLQEVVDRLTVLHESAPRPS